MAIGKYWRLFMSVPETYISISQAGGFVYFLYKHYKIKIQTTASARKSAFIHDSNLQKEKDNTRLNTPQ